MLRLTTKIKWIGRCGRVTEQGGDEPENGSSMTKVMGSVVHILAKPDLNLIC